MTTQHSSVLLDTGPLGLVTNPNMSQDALECTHWLQALVLHGVVVYIPEIADYEVRRELLRADKTAGLRRLDDLTTLVNYLPLSTETMRRAAELWAFVRKAGKPTADPHALDGDVILAAQALILGADTVVATTNVSHLSRFVTALHWRQIS